MPDGAGLPGVERTDVDPRARKGHGHLGTPFVELDRNAWRALRGRTPMTLDEADLFRLRGKTVYERV